MAQPTNGFTFDGANDMMPSAEDLMVSFCYTCHQAFQSCHCLRDNSVPQLQLPEQLPTHINPHDLSSNPNSQTASTSWLEDQTAYAPWAEVPYFNNDNIATELDMRQLGIPTQDSQARPFLTLNTDNLLRVTSVSPQSYNGSVSSWSPGADNVDEQSTSEQPPKAKRRKVAVGGPCKCHICGARYPRECDLNKHHKLKHLPREQRPHKCSQCDASFLYPKDVDRHRRSKHQLQGAPVDKVFCNHDDCREHGGFSRPDNLARHARNKHSSSTVVTEGSFGSGSGSNE